MSYELIAGAMCDAAALIQRRGEVLLPVLRNFKRIAELPRSKEPWQIFSWNGVLVLANHNHPQMVVRGCKLEVLEPEYPMAL